MDGNLPFTVLKRKDSKFYYCRFKDENGKYVSWKSTKETEYDEAVKKSWKFYRDSFKKVEEASFRRTVRSQDINQTEALFILEEFKQRGIISSYVLCQSVADVKAIDFLNSFWNAETSDYIKEKARMNKKPHRRYLKQKITCVNTYWKPVLKDKLLGEISRKDIKAMYSYLDNFELCGGTKNHIIDTILTPLKYAYNQEIIQKDISCGWIKYSLNTKKRKILTKEMVYALFNVEWEDKRAELANKLAMCTGMRSGEISALCMEDIGFDCIYVNHSYNYMDKLKLPKNETPRTEYIYSQKLLYDLMELGNQNPQKTGRRYIFSIKDGSLPCYGSVFVKGLRDALVKIGISPEDAKEYTFHAWRHFYAAYMKGKISDRLLQSQTGHKTLEMLEHYADHETGNERLEILKAQQEVFGDIVN